MTIRVTGVKGAKAGKGTFVSVDAFTVGKKRTATPKLAATWHQARSTRYFARRAAVSDLAGAAVSVKFRGTSITWTTFRNRAQGKARVYVDGVLKGTVDNYSALARYRVARTVRNLTDKVHTLRIVVLGKHRKASRGNMISVDRFRIG